MPKLPLRPAWATQDGRTVRLYLGEVRAVLAGLPAASVHCVVTSPPYWGLRDYGTGTWEGGDQACDHRTNAVGMSDKNTLGPSGYLPPTNAGNLKGRTYYRDVCGKCGARRRDDQLGQEPLPDCGRFAVPTLDRLLRADLAPAELARAAALLAELTPLLARREPCGRCFVCNMVAVFRAVRRVLRDDGTVFLNLGDSYSSGCMTGAQGPNSMFGPSPKNSQLAVKLPPRRLQGLPPGNLVGVPWRVALALQADGWVLRQDIVWAKKSPMPESVKNRCTKAHEYVFLLAKRPGYYYDAEAIKDVAKPEHFGRYRAEFNTGKKETAGSGRPGAGRNTPGLKPVAITSNKRSVWTVDDHRGLLDWLAANRPDALAAYADAAGGLPDVWRVSSQGYAGAHFATFPPKLVEPCVLAGTSERGACGKCGAPWRRVTDSEALTRERPNDYVKRTGAPGTGNSCANTVAGVSVRTTGWEPTCECFGRLERERVTVQKSAARYTGGDRNQPGDAGASPRDGVDKDTVVTRYVSDLPPDRHPVVPCVVLDPFVGSGTAGVVALRLGRHFVGIDLSEEYLRRHAVPRLSRQAAYRHAGSEHAKALNARLNARVRKGGR